MGVKISIQLCRHILVATPRVQITGYSAERDIPVCRQQVLDNVYSPRRRHDYWRCQECRTEQRSGNSSYLLCSVLVLVINIARRQLEHIFHVLWDFELTSRVYGGNGSYIHCILLILFIWIIFFLFTSLFINLQTINGWPGLLFPLTPFFLRLRHAVQHREHSHFGFRQPLLSC